MSTNSEDNSDIIGSFVVDFGFGMRSVAFRFLESGIMRSGEHRERVRERARCVREMRLGVKPDCLSSI